MGYGQLESDSIMCEEVGHALGLDHDWMPSSATCMSQNPAQRRWNSHDKGLIHGWFDQRGERNSTDRIKLVFDFAYSEPALRGTHHDWTAVGRRVVLALHEREDGQAFRPLNRQSVLLLSDDGTVSTIWTDPLTAAFDGRSLVEFRKSVTEAVLAIQQGLVTPQPERPVSAPSP